jgi:predicted nucleotidyltransferase
MEPHLALYFSAMMRRRPVRNAKASDPLSVALASGAMARLIRYFAVNPDARPHLRALERATSLRPRSLQVELERLTGLGLLRRKTDGRFVRFERNQENRLWAHFRALIRALSRPADLLPFAFAGVSGVEGAFIFGSHATGRARRESDVDVMVIGDTIDDRALARGALEAGVLLGREVNYITISHEELNSRTAASHRFYRSVATGQKEWLVGSPATLTRRPPHDSDAMK